MAAVVIAIRRRKETKGVKKPPSLRAQFDRLGRLSAEELLDESTVCSSSLSDGSSIQGSDPGLVADFKSLDVNSVLLPEVQEQHCPADAASDSSTETLQQ
eukprot:gnl/MRDRNA2_/MRDRNA2_38457_c0_seq1.p1 gnl/MRDRNA2_/MRDRNA2_38457_c0~~gnl/MRDRNA2_/MRDRNA2_38457_c0_seq1.p1  ORF type:complete len:100 (+),score=34.14 gnl/MRDRNA2_/MRDRNA2_38457_c0_seq1:94-393(+)